VIGLAQDVDAPAFELVEVIRGFLPYTLFIEGMWDASGYGSLPLGVLGVRVTA
jgi:hypothetical protein